MKKVLSILMCLIIVCSLSACIFWVPPEGWTNNHHSYEEVLHYAQSIDPDATVSKDYNETVDENDWEFREWDAEIKGINCHVASVSDWVWNSGFAAGEFQKVYYRIDTDYDNAIMRNILSDQFPDWETDMDLWSRYQINENRVVVKLNQAEDRMLDDDEIELVWQIAYSINEEYEKQSAMKKAVFYIPAPALYWNHHGEQRDFVKKNSFLPIENFSEEGKADFLKEYKEAWALLDSGLPVCDE